MFLFLKIKPILFTSHTLLYGFFYFDIIKESIMKNRVALIGIIVEDNSCTSKLNDLLHNYNHIIVGRLGVPYRDRNIGVISIIVDADMDIINELSGKLGKLKGLNAKTMYAKVSDDE